VLVLFVRASRRRLYCSCGFSTASAYDRSTRRWRHLDALRDQGDPPSRDPPVVLRRLQQGRHRGGGVGTPRARHTLAFEKPRPMVVPTSRSHSVAGFFRCDWASVTAIVTRVVTDHLARTASSAWRASGVDENSLVRSSLRDRRRQPRQRVRHLGRRGQERSGARRLLRLLGQERCARLEAVSMDMGRAYSAATRAKTTATICWDPFHVVKLLTKRSPTRFGGRT